MGWILVAANTIKPFENTQTASFGIGNISLSVTATAMRNTAPGLMTFSREDIWLCLLRINPDWDFDKVEAALRRFINNQPLHSGSVEPV